jgi:nucleotide-binding universal stress UspA family protein
MGGFTGAGAAERQEGCTVQRTIIHSILAATDLTVASDEVLRAAGALAAATGAALHVVHALDTAVAPSIADPADPDFLRWKARAEETLARQLGRVLPAGTVPATRELVLDLAHRAVLSRAAAVEAAVIVLGPHRGRPGGAPLLGGTADRVVRAAPCPCLVVRGRLDLPLARLLVPVDLASPSRGALQAALRWAGSLGACPAGPELPGCEVAVVHVIPPIAGGGALPTNRAAVGPRLHAAVEDALAGTPDVAVREEIVWGEGPADEIVGYAERQGAGLVVLATHGRGVLQRALLGSVAAAVAARATCSVLLVPPSRWAGEAQDAAADAAESAAR